MTTEARSAYAVFAETLAVNGIDTLFGLMGDANMQYLAEYIERDHGVFHAAAHEATGVSMADGYSRLSGRIGVATVTHGPGFTNALTALTEAVEARSCLLMLTGSTAPGRGRLQTIDTRALVSPTGAGYERVHSAETVVDDLIRALTRVAGERRPIVLDLPVELLTLPTRARPRAAVMPSDASPYVPGDRAVRDIARVIDRMERPVIVAGRGAAHARDEILALADAIGAPVATTLLAKGLFAGSERSLGVMGGLSYGAARDAVREADGVIAFGAGLNRFTVGLDDGLLEGKTVVQCDIDPARPGAQIPVAHAILGDAALTARALVHVVTGRRAEWAAPFLTSAMQEDPMAQYADADAGHGFSIAQATAVLTEALPADKNIVSDLGRFITAPWRLLDVETVGCFHHTGSFGSIGLGLGTALGAAVAAPERPTVLIVGDGALMMGIQEIVTAARLRIPLIIIVFDDGAYGAEYSKLEAYGHDPAHSLVTWPDLVDLMRAMGGEGAHAESADDVAAAVERALSHTGGPFLIDVRVDPRVDYTDWHLPSVDE